MIPLYKPHISEADIQAVTDVLRSGMLTTGGTVKKLEEEFATFIGAPYVLAFDSLTSGFLALLDAIFPKVANMPSATYISMANTLRKFNIPIQFRDKWIAGKAYAIETDKGTIMDSAHDMYRDQFKENPHAYWLYSTHATKLITTGTGGLLALGSEELYHHIKALRDSGRLRTSRKFDYIVAYAGWNLYQSDIHAALGLSQLRRFEELMSLRDECYTTYQKYLQPDPRDKRTKYIYQVWVENILGCADYLQERGIQVSKHFTPIHTQPAFFTGQSLPISENLSSHLLSIPYYPEMPEDDIKTVSEELNRWRNQ